MLSETRKTVGRLGRALTPQWIKQRRGPEALVLVYHRAAALPSDPQLLAVTPDHFAEHLEVLRRYYCPTRLRVLDQANGEVIKGRMVVVTFDDGYADNLENARPLLERHDVPATCFITTGYVGGEREFWWDELERILLQPGTLPATLNLSLNGTSYHWELDGDSSYSVADFRRYQAWHVERGDDPTPRHKLYRSLCHLLRPLTEIQRQPMLEALVTWAGAISAVRSTHRPLSPEDVARLAEGGLVEVGSHSVTHSVMSALPADAQWNEITNSKTRLEEIVGGRITSFAYPYGSRSDYTRVTMDLLKAADFDRACTNVSKLVRPGTNRFRLSRFLMRDCDGEAFGRLLSGWFHD
jgi:peptidoglycan/xylan/chitin deacetylase (PgdA/CDA1 family)